MTKLVVQRKDGVLPTEIGYGLTNVKYTPQQCFELN